MCREDKNSSDFDVSKFTLVCPCAAQHSYKICYECMNPWIEKGHNKCLICRSKLVKPPMPLQFYNPDYCNKISHEVRRCLCACGAVLCLGVVEEIGKNNEFLNGGECSLCVKTVYGYNEFSGPLEMVPKYSDSSYQYFSSEQFVVGYPIKEVSNKACIFAHDNEHLASFILGALVVCPLCCMAVKEICEWWNEMGQPYCEQVVRPKCACQFASIKNDVQNKLRIITQQPRNIIVGARALIWPHDGEDHEDRDHEHNE